MATLKEVQTKISGVKKTKQITKAMNMVAASRLRGAQMAMNAFKPYAEKYAEVLGSLSERASGDANPLLIKKEEIKNIHLIICTSDRGLCGGFNANLVKKAEGFIEEKQASSINTSVTNFGKKGRDSFKKSSVEIVDEHIGVVGSSFNFSVASNSGQLMINKFLEGIYDEVYVLYASFKGMGRQVPIIRQLLPVSAIDAVDKDLEAPYQAEHICEPSPDELLGEMLPKNIFIQIHNALLETSTSEHAARMSAMDNATKACNDLVEELTLVYNKARQAGITADLMDIVGGAEALKG